MDDVFMGILPSVLTIADESATAPCPSLRLAPRGSIVEERGPPRHEAICLPDDVLDHVSVERRRGRRALRRGRAAQRRPALVLVVAPAWTRPTRRGAPE